MAEGFTARLRFLETMFVSKSSERIYMTNSFCYSVNVGNYFILIIIHQKT